jgi:hypothetical protein
MKYLILFIAISTTSLTSCSGDKKKKPNDSVTTIIDTTFWADKNYPYRNLKNTLPVANLIKFDRDRGYTDSTKKRVLVELSKQQKLHLIAPFISRELTVDNKYAVDLMQAYFISKQDKIGQFQPIVIYITGDDYTSLTMIILNKNNDYVSGFNVHGGMLSGPEEVGDSIEKFEARRYSIIGKSEITTFKIDESDFTDSLKRPSIIDSIVFKSYIDNKGKIKTKQILKKSYIIPYQ